MPGRERLKELGLSLPPAPAAVAAYVPAVTVGQLVFTSGQLPFRDGQVAFTGRAGDEASLEQVYEATRLAALNALAAIAALGVDLDNLKRVVRVVGYIQSDPQFHDQPKGLNGASELLLELFGERGRHSRSAVGVSALPLDALCEVELVVELGGPGG